MAILDFILSDNTCHTMKSVQLGFMGHIEQNIHTSWDEYYIDPGYKHADARKLSAELRDQGPRYSLNACFMLSITPHK